MQLWLMQFNSGYFAHRPVLSEQDRCEIFREWRTQKAQETQGGTP